MTLDTNIAVYALSDEGKHHRAREILALSDFASVQVFNEYARTAQRKLRRNWQQIGQDIDLLEMAVPDIRPVHAGANREAVRIAERYQIQFYDAVMIAVALENGATTLYSEDMQHGLVIDDTLTITNPFLSTEPQ